jgi:hypothetical protein
MPRDAHRGSNRRNYTVRDFDDRRATYPSWAGSERRDIDESCAGYRLEEMEQVWVVEERFVVIVRVRQLPLAISFLVVCA